MARLIAFLAALCISFNGAAAQHVDSEPYDWRNQSFPHDGLARAESPRETNGGTGFVLFDPASGRSGEGSQTIYAAVADPVDRRLYHSNDGGESWAEVRGGPGPGMLTVRGDLDDEGNLYIAYSTGIGPNRIELFGLGRPAPQSVYPATDGRGLLHGDPLSGGDGGDQP